MKEATMAQIAAIMRDETLTPALKQRFTQVSHCFVHASSLMLFDHGLTRNKQLPVPRPYARAHDQLALHRNSKPKHLNLPRT